MSDLDKVHAFLNGECELDGVEFGERHPTERGAFWWRKHLRAAVLADRAERAETVGVPEGYALVPVEPDDDMIEKGCAEHECDQGDPWYSAPDLSEGDCKRIYAAMIAAAPTQERGADDEQT